MQLDTLSHIIGRPMLEVLQKKLYQDAVAHSSMPFWPSRCMFVRGGVVVSIRMLSSQAISFALGDMLDAPLFVLGTLQITSDGRA